MTENRKVDRNRNRDRNSETEIERNKDRSSQKWINSGRRTD